MDINTVDQLYNEMLTIAQQEVNIFLFGDGEHEGFDTEIEKAKLKEAKMKLVLGVMKACKIAPSMNAQIKRNGKSEAAMNLTEVHYAYRDEHFKFEQATAFESDIEGTGYTIENDELESFEVKPTLSFLSEE